MTTPTPSGKSGEQGGWNEVTSIVSDFQQMNEQDQMQTLMAELQNSNMRRSVMEYIANKECGIQEQDDKERMKSIITDIAQESVSRQKETALWKGRTKKSIFIAVVAVILAIVVQFLVNYFTNEISKESHVNESGTMVGTDGKVVKTQNDEMQVNADGTLVARSTESRRLADGAGTVKTTPSLNKIALASSLPDSTFAGLEEVAVYSDKGHTLLIKVHGFSRVPVLNSRCGNIVHIYTAWKGRITLDSTDLSFDAGTADEFSNAGFSLAVGGVGGRRLTGGSTVDGFFKHMQGLQASGSWTCADVPLPTITATNSRTETTYFPCGDMCKSRYGGFVPGAGQLESKHALAAMGKASRIAAVLKSTTSDAVYVKSNRKVMRSASYQVQFDTYPSHPGQQLVTIFNRGTKASVEFQSVAGEARSHCEAEQVDQAMKGMEDAGADAGLDTDMHFEFMDMVEEDGQVLRHFRMMMSDAFLTFIGAEDGGSRPTDSYTEYWDVADTLQPYRILSGDGAITVFDDITTSCSDDEVKAAVAARASGSMDALMTCSAEEKEKDLRPTMSSEFADLDANGVGHYINLLANGAEDAQDEVEALAQGGDSLAAYLVRSRNPLAMPDHCYDLCKPAMERLVTDLQAGTDVCGGSLAEALSCAQNSQVDACMSSKFVNEHFEECDTQITPGADADGDSGATRRLADTTVSESMVPAHTLADGTQEVDLAKVSPQLQATLAKGMDSPRLLFNTTNKHGDSAVIMDGRRLKMTFPGTLPCNSKHGVTYWKGDGWCKAWKFRLGGNKFDLVITWGNIGGYMGLALECESCVDISKLFHVPPPLVVDFCIGGAISAGLLAACPEIPLSIEGKVYWALHGYADLSVLKITIAKLEIGIAAGIGTFIKESWCWWVSGEGRRRRRRWWSRRRRDWRACNYRKECDVYVRGYAQLQFTLFRLRLEENYWVKHKCLTLDFKIFVFEFWKAWWGGWKQMYHVEFLRYYF